MIGVGSGGWSGYQRYGPAGPKTIAYGWNQFKTMTKDGTSDKMYESASPLVGGNEVGVPSIFPSKLNRLTPSS